MKNKHHYVPRFYLNRFASSPRQINIFHLGEMFSKRSVGLKDQCQSHKFYGKTDELEDILAKLEGIFGSILKNLLDSRAKFYLSDEESKWLLLFVGLQMTRTTAAAELINDTTDKITKAILSKQAAAENIDLSKVRIGYDNPIFHALRLFVVIAASLHDLVPQMLVNKSPVGFITSDNPVVLYNQYTERIKGIKTTGTKARGLQVLLPLSPAHAILLYDPKIYNVSDRDTRISIVTDVRDVLKINLLTAINAEEVLLFSDWSDEPVLRKLIATEARHHRAGRSQTVREYASEENPLKSLLHLTGSSVNVGLNLSFMSLRRRVQRIPLEIRIREFRDLPTPVESAVPGELFRLVKK